MQTLLVVMLGWLVQQTHSAECTDQRSFEFNLHQRKQIVWCHNIYRQKYIYQSETTLPKASYLNELLYSQTLETEMKAKIQAECTTVFSQSNTWYLGDNITINGQQGPYGYSIYKFTGQAYTSFDMTWLCYKFNNQADQVLINEPYKPNKVYDQFTQMIWAKSRFIGCYGVKFPSTTNPSRTEYVMGCAYFPSGNTEGEKVYSTSGQPGDCSQCNPPQCSSVFKGLCKTPPLTDDNIATTTYDYISADLFLSVQTRIQITGQEQTLAKTWKDPYFLTNSMLCHYASGLLVLLVLLILF